LHELYYNWISYKKIYGEKLDKLIQTKICSPLQLNNTCYNPLNNNKFGIHNVVPTEMCKWRNKRLIGEVHDENAAIFGGISGNAGIFSSAKDLTIFGATFLGLNPLLKPETIAEMTSKQAEFQNICRGLGFVLWSNDTSLPHTNLSKLSFGHTGFTGTSMFIDTEKKIVCVCLTNRVYFGRNNIGELINFRREIHNILAETYNL